MIWPALVLALTFLLLKPFLFSKLLKSFDETQNLSMEIGVRLGQVSEFSLLVAYVAMEQALISATASYLIQVTTILTFMASSYYLVLKYPTPIALSDKLRRD